MQSFPSTGGRFSDDLCLEMPSRSGAWVPQGFWGWLWVWGHPIASYTLILFGTQIHTKVSIFGAICFDQQHDQSISIIRSSQLLQVSSVTPSEALPWNPRCDSIFRPQIGQWVSPTILCWRNRDLGFCRYERNKRVQQTPESVFPQLLLPYSPPTLDKYLGRHDWFPFLVFQWNHGWALTSAKTGAKEKGEKTGLDKGDWSKLSFQAF